MTWKVNLKEALNLPVDVGAYVTDKGFCAMGSLFSAILGADNVLSGLELDENGVERDIQGEQKTIELVLETLGFDVAWAAENFDRVVWLGKEDPKEIRRRCVMQMVEEGVKAGIFELVA